MGRYDLMKDFVSFLLNKVYCPKAIEGHYIDRAFELTVIDVRYHLPSLSGEEIQNRIIQNFNELALFLFRLGNILHKDNHGDLLP
jgi:serine O-acetyltransferase